MSKISMHHGLHILVLRIFLPLFLWLSIVSSASAQQSGQQRPAGPSLYAVNGASIATAMTYCMSKYGHLTVGSPGEVCLSKARNLLAGYGLRQQSEKIDQSCRDPGKFNTCITPEIGKLVIALNNLFDERGI